MTERQTARHTVQISFKAGDGPTVELKCHGDKDSACWWTKDEDGHPAQGDHCSLVEWQEETNCIFGTLKLPVEVVSWGEDGPVMEPRLATFVQCAGEDYCERCQSDEDLYHKEKE